MGLDWVGAPTGSQASATSRIDTAPLLENNAPILLCLCTMKHWLAPPLALTFWYPNLNFSIDTRSAAPADALV